MKLSDFNVVKIISDLLGEKDTSNETAEFLKELDYPHISDLLPVVGYDKDSGIFYNRNSLGFIIEAQPLIGANEQIVEGLDRILQNNIPRDHPLQIILLGSQAVKEQLEYGLQNFSWKGHRAEECNNLTRSFYLDAAQNNFKNNADHPLTLRDYRLFFAYSIPVKNANDVSLMKVKETRRSLISSLNSNSIHCQEMNINRFCALVREIVNFQYGKLSEYPDEYITDKYLNKQLVNSGTKYLVKHDYIEITTNNIRGEMRKSRSVSMHLDSNPHEHYLWQNGNLLADLMNPDRGISYPFIFNMTISTADQLKSNGEANRKFWDLEKKANSSFAKFIPSTVREFEEWKNLRTNLQTGNTALSQYHLGIRFFCPDDDDLMSKETEKINKSFESQGLKIVRSDFMQMRGFLASVPFAVTDNPKLWRDFITTGSVLRAETFQAVNLLPIIADNKLSRSGIVLPSYRNQIAFLDLFDESLPNTNFNWFESGTSGAGKSVVSQAIARQVLDRNGILSIFDIGDSYKAFCQSMGGTYINGSTLRFNPFANITDIAMSAERVRDQLSILASPNGMLDEVHETLILDAITEQFPEYQQGMRIDHVVDYLKKHRNRIHDQQATRITDRIDEIVLLLTKYTTKGIYGEFFNSDEPTLRDDMQFVVTELGDLRSNGNLLMAVLFTLMIWSENMMYRTERSVRKMNIIDEGWKLLSASNDKIRTFIEEGYRTARRHNGSYGTVTQSINDKNLSTAARASYNNSSFKFTLMQDAKSFQAFKNEEPNAFSEMEFELISKFPPARQAGYSSLLVNVGEYSSFHRLLLDPLTNALFSSKGDDFTYREKRLKEGADIKDILFEMSERDNGDLVRYLRSKRYE